VGFKLQQAGLNAQEFLHFPPTSIQLRIFLLGYYAINFCQTCPRCGGIAVPPRWHFRPPCRIILSAFLSG
jgi:hypothetical protein